MKFKEWPSLGRVNDWGCTWHRDLPEVTPQSWATFIPDSPTCFSHVECTRAAAAEVPRAGCHLASCQCWTCQRSGKESLEGLFSVGLTRNVKAHPSEPSEQPLSPHPEALLEAGWTWILAPPLHCQEPRLSHLLCEVWEQTQVECFEWCLAPKKSWVQVPGYLPAIIIMSQIAT